MSILDKRKQGLQWSKIQDGIGELPWEYSFLYNLPESEYPKYLKKIFKYRTGENLNLKHPKTFNEKIQWIKLYGVTPLMRDCTDKVKVRDYVREKIGEEYLKPVLQIIPNESHETMRCHCEQTNDHLMSARQSTDICQDTPDCHGTQNVVVPRNDRTHYNKNNDITTYFDQINFDKLPNSFVMKCSHGCKWQYIIKNKEEYLKNKRLFDITRRQITGWLEQEFWVWEGFEMQYKGIEPKILIEPLMRDEINIPSQEIQIYFINNLPKLVIKLHNDKQITLYDENLNCIDEKFSEGDQKIFYKPDDILKQTIDLSIKLIKNSNFKFVRADWMIYQNKPYFEELTFTPYSGFRNINKKIDINYLVL